MRKHFLILMLLALLPLAGWAQFSVDNYVPKGKFIYKITQAAVGETPGRVVLYGIRAGQNPVDESKALNLEGKITIQIVDGPSYDFIVDYALDDALKKTYNFVNYSTNPTLAGAFEGMTIAESVVIPKEFLTIKNGTFYGYTNMKSISFEANSEVKTIESGAFNTTQIKTFDFSNCSKLTAINEGLFVEADPAINSYVETIILPESSEALTTIGTAFQRLTNLSEIRNLDKSLIETVVANAFSGDVNLTSLSLPATVKTIKDGAFKNSGIATLTIDVTSMETLGDGGANGVYGEDVPGHKNTETLTTLNLKGVLSGTISANAFKGMKNLATLNMADAEKPFVINEGTIGTSAFENCTALTSLNFNDITKGTIRENAFKGCSALTSVVFGAITGVDVLQKSLIGESAFENCTKIGLIQFGNLQFVQIADKAFKNCGTAGAVEEAELLFNGTLAAVAISTGATASGNGAFAGCTKLKTITFGESAILYIGKYAFENSATVKAATLTFADASAINIDENAFKGCTMIQTIEFGDIDGVAPGDNNIETNAFLNCEGLKTLSFGNLKFMTIKSDAFKNATSGLTGTNYATANFGNLEGTTIKDAAFDGATRLNTVIIGDVTEASAIGAGAAVFPAVKSVTIGTVKGAANTIAANAFTFANQSGATLKLATGEGKYLEGTAAGMIATGAFDFTAVTTAESAAFKHPVITVGKLKTANDLAAGAFKGSNIKVLTFDGDIATGALAETVIKDNADDVAALTLRTLTFNGDLAAGAIAANAFASLPVAIAITFNGEIATGGIATDAFKNLVAVNTITFTGKLAQAAVATGAFEGLKENSEVIYTYNKEDIDLTVNPFAKEVFKAGSDKATARIIKFAVTNEDLKAKFQGATGFTTGEAFDIYLAYFFIPTDLSFLVYPDIVSTAKHTASPTVAWARWELGYRVAEGITGSLKSGDNLVIKRQQEIDGTNKAKITIYGTYTDEDNAMQTSTIYMIPLKVKNGYYHIPGTNKTTLIVKVENAADFTENSYKVKVNQGGYDLYNAAVTGGTTGSIWPGLQNTELYVASNIMTNQQLIDKQATDAANVDASGIYGYFHAARGKGDIDIYRGGAAIAEDLYIMSDPSKNKGFRIDKNEITALNDAYINAGWYYMLLKKYTAAAPAPAHVVWMDDASDETITGILEVKQNAKNNSNANNAIYNLQGIRVNGTQKGIYIMNGKKYVVK